MLQDFKNNIQNLNLFSRKDTLLIAVSGGIDSVVLLNLIVKSGFTCGIAHCNFSLRDEESEGDEQFVKSLASKYHLPLFSVKFDTKKYAKLHGISIQMAARELRYNWFEKTITENGFSYILTGHNLNDNIETFFINIIRGTGIAGITGMDTKSGNIIRPLLFATREQIHSYCIKEKIDYREDSSNAENKYIRNKIRNQIIPLIKEINQNFTTAITDNISKFKEIESIYLWAIQDFKHKNFELQDDIVIIQISAFNNLEPLNTFIFEIFKKFNFSHHQTIDIKNVIKAETGKHVDSDSYRILKDRERLIISPLHKEDTNKYLILKNKKTIFRPIRLSIKTFIKGAEYKIQQNVFTATLDNDKLKYPLQIRKWKSGDYFFPFGMKQKKKLSDYFTDHKFSQIDKQNTWLITSENEIIWIVGHRADNRFRVTENTKKITVISITIPITQQ